jgi:type VII secretion-associated serine protease mycosin
MTAVLVAVLTSAPALADTPTQPPAPPVVNPGNLQSNQCAPPSLTVVDTVPWAQQRLVPQRAWPTTKGAGQLVAVVDSGVDAGTPQLARHVESGIDVIAGHGSANSDCVGHGTFVAGIIAAQPVAGVGFVGIAPDATILPIRQTSNGDDGSVSGMAVAIRDAVDAHATVINVSAASQFGSDGLAAAVDYANQHNVIVVAAASNDAQNGNPTAYPAAYPGVIAVAAINQDGARAGFSEVGNYVSVAAPGDNILSTGPRGPGHLVGKGTSFAAPFVSGVAALVRAAHPDLTVAQVKHRLEATADHPASVLPDPQLGWGVVNPYAAVTQVLPEESGSQVAKSPPVVVAAPLVPGADPGRVIGLAVAASAFVLAIVAALGRVLVPQGTRRRWRPAHASEVNKEDSR